MREGPNPMTRKTICLALCLVLAATGSARAVVLLRLDDYDTRGLKAAGFELARKAHVEIDALGVRNPWSDEYAAYAWIIDANTRRVVWSQEDSDGKRDRGEHGARRDRRMLRSHESVDLGPGRYELYAWAGLGFNNNIHFHFSSLGNLRNLVDLADSHDDGEDQRFKAAVRDCYVELASSDIQKSDVKDFDPAGELPGAILRANRLGDHAFVEKGLRVDKPLDLRLYGTCEWPREGREPVDATWIINADTRERVWELSRRNTEDAGGAEKNRSFDTEVHLDAGRYVLCAGTDDSHSYDEFNAAPPYDPAAWGVQVLPGHNFDAAAFHVEAAPVRGEPVVDLTKASDNDVLERGFKLSRDGDVLVYAVGEWNDSGDEFADRGWITRAGTHDIVWEMKERNTHHAGGAEKNRMFDGLVKLAAGDYVAHFETDDSHSYRHWNSDAPYDRDAWGLAIYPAHGMTARDFQISDLRKNDDDSSDKYDKPADALVSITHVRNHAHEHETFTLAHAAKVHIYAVGEGVDREMADYGWIEDTKTGDVVWEMTWRKTHEAGGARKNREFDADVLLDAGTYEVYYETDGSHAYGAWNDRRPDDPSAWGITITPAKP